MATTLATSDVTALRERIVALSAQEPNTGCWLWAKQVKKDGYGRIGVEGHRTVLAHRVSYQVFNGPIPAGLTIDHLCRVRCCVNPDHLEAVTIRENVSRSPIAKHARRTHCLRGHSLSNARVWRGERYCRMCDAMRHRKDWKEVR